MNQTTTTTTQATTAVIADDEPLLAQSLAAQLTRLWPALTVVHISHNGQEALDAIHRHQPDIAFLDINMPFLSGMDIAAALQNSDLDPRPHVVFVTAYDQYAVDAFDQQALDYLLKPYTEARLIKAIQRFQEHKRPVQPPDNEQQTAHHRTHISVSIGQKRLILPITEIAFFQSDGKYTRALGPRADYLLNEPLKQLEAELPADTFWRIHRSAIVNTAFIDHGTRTGTGRLEVFLTDMTETLIVSRRYLHRFNR